MNNVIPNAFASVNADLKKYDQHITRLLSVLDDNLTQTTRNHQAILNFQKQNLSSLFPPIVKSKPVQNFTPARAAIFSNEQLREFGNGSIEKCFGVDYALLDKRESPRIPNGDLLMIDHITSISGEPKKLSPPAAISSEFIVEKDAWFLDENEYSGVPLSILMEIALQPCGILSAFLGTSLMLPPENNRFRNLDGHIHFIKSPNLSGKTITNHAVLKDAFTSGGMHIQKYSFELATDYAVFLRGESTFGYFTKSAMEQQAGLGPIAEIINSAVEEKLPIKLGTRHKKHLGLVDSAGYMSLPAPISDDVLIFGEKTLSGNEWFYSSHFYQDPVMPGSLGAEAIMQMVWAFLKEKGFLEKLNQPQFSFANTSPFIWKYRGQVTPANKKIRLQAHLRHESKSLSGVNVTVNADFWVDDLRIYSFNNLVITVREGQI